MVVREAIALGLRPAIRGAAERATARCLPAHSAYCMRSYPPSDLKTSKSPDGGTPSARRRRRMNNKENIS